MEKEARQLRMGILGCGPIAQAAHFEACRRARNAELYAICDLAEDLVAWYLQSSQVECFSARDGQYHRVLGADAHVYKLQLEGFADAILHDAPLHGASIEDGVAALRALVAISRSDETGAWVSLADVTGGV